MDAVLNNTNLDDRKPGKANRTALIGDQNFNFATVEFDDRKVTGAQIAMAVHKHPVDEYVVLQHLKTGELETLRPTETADLGEPEIERFFVIKGFQTNRFTVEGLAMEWPLETLLASQIKFFVGAGEDQMLVLERDGVDQTFDDDDTVNIGGDIAERFKLRKRKQTVTVIYGSDIEYELERRVYTTEELMAAFGVPSGYKLDFIAPDGTFREMAPGERLKIKEGMEFASHPPVGQSS